MIYGLFAKHVYFPFLDRVKRADFNAALEEAEHNQYRPRSELAALQLRKLREIVAHAEQHCPYYATRFREHGVAAAELRSIEDLRRFPLLSKEDVFHNHDAMLSTNIAATGPFSVELPGVTLAVLDTVRPRTDRGRVSQVQLEWLAAVADTSTVPVLVFGHHHPWNPGDPDRNDDYFGINPDDSEYLCDVINRHEAIAGYFAGHTHRTRKRVFEQARNVPIVEIACVKDYPGAWAEYRIYDGGYVQLTRRIDGPQALAWTEQTRHMFAGLYRDYALGGLDDRCFMHMF